MSTHSRASDIPPRYSWRRFWLYLGMFFVAFTIAGLLPTPGSWSDSRSHWLPLVAIALIDLLFLMAAHWDYHRLALLSRLQVWILSLLLGTLFLLTIVSLWECIAFRLAIRKHLSETAEGMPNHRLQATAGCALVPGFAVRSAVPEPCRSAVRCS